MMLDATIQASRLQHAIKVLHRVDDEAIFKIADGKIMSSVANPANTLMVQVEIDAIGKTVGYINAAEPHAVRIDLERLAGIVKRAAAKDTIRIEADDLDTWQITRGVFQRTMRLIDLERLRKYPDWIELSHTVAIKLTGKQFKEIIAEAAAIGNSCITIYATEEVMIIKAISEDIEGDYSTATLPADQYYEMFEAKTACNYSLNYLKDTAADMKATDSVAFRFSADASCEIEYERDGVKIRFMLAPRIEPV